jgi:hypothetical protein
MWSQHVWCLMCVCDKSTRCWTRCGTSYHEDRLLINSQLLSYTAVEQGYATAHKHQSVNKTSAQLRCHTAAVSRGHMKTWCRHIARVNHPSETKWNTKSGKHSCKNNACSQEGLSWQTQTIGLPPWPPLSSFTEAVTIITVWELSNTASYYKPLEIRLN